MVVDTARRVLELALLLERAWERAGLPQNVKPQETLNCTGPRRQRAGGGGHCRVRAGAGAAAGAWERGGLPRKPHLHKTLIPRAHAGSALVVVDTAGRVLELALLLERHWERAALPYALALLAPMGRNVLAFAGAQLEWMSDGLPRALEHSRSNPFALRRARPLLVSMG